VISSGIPLLNDKLGGGVPYGVVEIYGEEATGKTALALAIAAESTRAGNPVLFVNQEHRASPEFIRNSVGDLCVIASPSYGEAAIECAYSGLRNGVKVIIIDTTDALVPLKETLLTVGDREPVAQRRLVYHGFKVLSEEAVKRESCVIAVSQVRTNLRLKRPRLVSSFEKVFKKVAKCRIELIRSSTKGEYGVTKVIKVKATIKKLLQHPPLGTEFIYLWANRGFDRNFELLRKLIDSKAVSRRGAYWKNGVITLGPGYESAVAQIASEYDLYSDLL
jgi:recombination protein RecA